MKRKRWLYVLFGLLAIMVVVVVIILALNYKSNGTDNVQKRIEAFDQTIARIKDEFTYEDFDEVMQDKTLFMGLPAEYHQVNELGIVLDLQKLFVYMDSDTGTTIMLQVTLDPYSDVSRGEWYSSIGYRPEAFNSQDGYYGVYNEKVPDITVGGNGFLYQGISYSIIAFSQYGTEPDALEVMTDFSNALIKFVKIRE